MDFAKDLEMEKWDFECDLRLLIMKSEKFKELFPNIDLEKMEHSKEENTALNIFKQNNEDLYDIIKEEVKFNNALILLKRRCEIECYKRLNLPFAKNYLDNEDLISIISDNDLIELLKLIRRLL